MKSGSDDLQAQWRREADRSNWTSAWEERIIRKRENICREGGNLAMPKEHGGTIPGPDSSELAPRRSAPTKGCAMFFLSLQIQGRSSLSKLNIEICR